MDFGMAAAALRPETKEERIVYYAICWTWAFWLLGALYLVAPCIGWYLAVLALRRYLGQGLRPGQAPPSIPLGVQVWCYGMALMLVALLAGHINYGLDAGQIVKSSMGWAKGWALFAVFPWVGAMLPIRASIIYRATNKLAAQTLLLIPVFVAAALAHLPHPLYTSPLLALGGPGPEYFNVELYSIDNTNGALRWRFFAPWAPAAAFVANVSFFFALHDRDWRWKWIGIAACIAICLMTASRLALVAIPGSLLIGALASNLTRPIVVGLSSLVTTAGCFSVPFIVQLVNDFSEKFNGARAASTRVRSVLRSIALHRWQSEAVFFGHGIVEKGPHLVEHMPIGSHHSWYGILFVKGVVGLIGLAMPLFWTCIELILKAQTDRVARCALGVTLICIFYTFGENLEILAYVIWPGLTVMGIAFRRRVFLPMRHRLGA